MDSLRKNLNKILQFMQDFDVIKVVLEDQNKRF
jgi:hypothetical protein